MQDVSKGEGRTVLFVSHNMASIRNLCHHGVLLENGNVRFTGEIDSVISEYLMNRNSTHVTDLMDRFKGKQLPDAYINRVCFKNSFGGCVDSAMAGEPFDIEVSFCKQPSKVAKINIGIYDSIGDKRLHLSTEYVCLDDEMKEKKEGTAVFHFDKCPLPGGSYILNFTMWEQDERKDWIQNMVTLDVSVGDFYHCGKIPSGKENQILLDYSCKIQ